MSKLNPLAKKGFAKGGALYDAHRPGYTCETVNYIAREIQSLKFPCSSLVYDVLELGAGTGKLTQQLVPKLGQKCRYLATEPSEEFMETLLAKGLRLETKIASASAIPAAHQSVGSVVCAQCFHWFSEEENLKEIHRILVPGGKLILVWNRKNFNVGWMAEVWKQRKEIFEKLGYSMEFQVATDAWKRYIDVSPLFKLQENKSLDGIDFRSDLNGVIENLKTVSAYNALTPEESKAYLYQLRQKILHWPGLDPTNIEIPYYSDIYVYSSQVVKE